MNRSLLYVGIDVDDKSFHVALKSKSANDFIEFKCQPSPEALLKKLKKYDKTKLRICYEASYLGFSLQRSLSKSGYQCEVIAPSLIPTLPGMKQKTDRIDARKLAEYYMNNLLTSVHIPTLEDEMDRDLVRSRRFLAKQSIKLKNRMSGIIRTLGWNYRQETNRKSYWNQSHLKWLETKINSCESASLKINMIILQKQLKETLDNLSLYQTEIENLASTEKYNRKVGALNCYRGIDTCTSMMVITELGDVKRFKSPTNLFSYCGFDIIEYSSGGKEKKYSMSKDLSLIHI